jgi:hypothetical protein
MSISKKKKKKTNKTDMNIDGNGFNYRMHSEINFLFISCLYLKQTEFNLLLKKNRQWIEYF